MNKSTDDNKNRRNVTIYLHNKQFLYPIKIESINVIDNINNNENNSKNNCKNNSIIVFGPPDTLKQQYELNKININSFLNDNKFFIYYPSDEYKDIYFIDNDNDNSTIRFLEKKNINMMIIFIKI